MLTIRIDEKRIYIIGGKAFDFAVSPDNELIVEAPEGVKFVIGGREGQAVSAASAREPDERTHLAPLAEVSDDSLLDPQVPGMESYAYLRAVLQHHGRPMSTAELTERVLAETAYQTEAVDPQNTLRTALGRKPEMFTREKTGGESIWGLAEWV